MTIYSALGWVLALLLLPLAWMLIDAIGGVRARHSAAVNVGTFSVSDFAVLVPIYGNIRYLENVDYLATYGPKVVLCTTTHETDEFNRALIEIASRHGFRIFRAHAAPASHDGKRATGGTVRDTVIREVLPTLAETYVVCIDADTTTTQPLEILIGAMVSRGLDVASIRLVPSNARHSIMTRLQAYEYRLAMKMRVIAPWLVSGACHAGRTEALRDVMRHHSLFFQGNDVETGVLAEGMGYRVGHVPFEVPTTVPETFRAWWRQHLAWAGGEFRLFVVNARIGLRHPYFWSYGLIVTILMLPLRWHAIVHANSILAIVVVLYIALGLYLHRAGRDLALLAVPFYAAFISLVLVPLGAFSYAKMALSARNAGVIRVPERSVRSGSDRETTAAGHTQ
ncbi:N-acetylglucosaminyltransferase [Pseudonocardia sp. TMWB2A]|uniref:glycosyltransferase family 2 protein n=1 Tax=Pseudonocardia sp. TMWB2A TaxID=687430 RepID=UPI00307D5A1F